MTTWGWDAKLMEHEPHYTYWQIILGRLYEMNVLWILHLQHEYEPHTEHKQIICLSYWPTCFNHNPWGKLRHFPLDHRIWVAQWGCVSTPVDIFGDIPIIWYVDLTICLKEKHDGYYFDITIILLFWYYYHITIIWYFGDIPIIFKTSWSFPP